MDFIHTHRRRCPADASDQRILPLTAEWRQNNPPTPPKTIEQADATTTLIARSASQAASQAASRTRTPTDPPTQAWTTEQVEEWLEENYITPNRQYTIWHTRSAKVLGFLYAVTEETIHVNLCGIDAAH